MPPHMGGKNPKGKAKNFKKSLKRMIVDFKNEKTLIIVVILFLFWVFWFGLVF